MPISDSHGQKPERGAFVTGGWTVEPSRNLLIRGDEQVHLEPRVMDVLGHLAARRGIVVSKDELVAAVWEGRYVSDDVLTVTIYALRKALGDDARQARYIETVPRRGYRWLAPVEDATAASGMAPAQPVPRRGVRWRLAGAVGLALLVGVVVAVWRLAPSLRVGPVRSPAAHEAYVKGRYFLDQRSVTGLRQALEQFERAIALDPQDPAAHGGLADTYSSMADFGVASPAELRPRAMAAAGRALDLNPESAEAHAALGRAQFLFDWDFARAESSLIRATALDANYMPAQQAMSWLRSARGEHAEAIAAARRALQLDPVNTARYRELAWVLALGGQQEAAVAELERALQLDPRSVETLMMKGWARELAGRPDEAFAAYREGLRAGGAPDEALQRIQTVYETQGLVGYYRGWLERQRRTGGMPMSNTWRAHIYVRVGDLDRAIESLEEAYQKRESALAWVRVEPNFDVLRSDARFQRIAARVGEPQEP